MSVKLPKELIEQLDRLMAQLARGESEVRATAMKRLIGYEQSGQIPLPLLLEMADDPNPAIAMYAVGALGRNGQADSVRKLISMASEYAKHNALFVETVIDALGEAGSPEASGVLLELIGRGGSLGRKLFGKLGGRRAEKKDAEARKVHAYLLLPVVRALEAIGDPRATAQIADLLDHEDPLIRCHVIRAFANAGSRTELAKLNALAQEDPTELVREVAQLAVEKLAPVTSELSN